MPEKLQVYQMKQSPFKLKNLALITSRTGGLRPLRGCSAAPSQVQRFSSIQVEIQQDPTCFMELNWKSLKLTVFMHLIKRKVNGGHSCLSLTEGLDYFCSVYTKFPPDSENLFYKEIIVCTLNLQKSRSQNVLQHFTEQTTVRNKSSQSLLWSVRWGFWFFTLSK